MPGGLTGLAYGATPGERATMAGALASLFAAGALLVAITLVLPAGDEAGSRLGVAVVAGVAAGVAGLLASSGRRASVGVLQGTLAGGSVLIALCVWWGGRLGEAYPVMWVWVALYAWAFFSVRAAVVQMVLLAGLAGVVFVAQDGIDVPGARWVMVVGSVLTAGVLVGRLVTAVRAQAEDLAAVSRMARGLSDVALSAQAACDGLRGSARADVAIFLEPLADGGGLQVTAMSGPSEAGLAFTGEGARRALQQAFRAGDVAPVLAEEPASFGRRTLGLAQPVLRSGEPVAVLAVAWTSPRRSAPPRMRQAALLFAAQAAVAMDRAEEERLDRERQALEINDTIVQGLVVAKYCAQRGDVAQALEAIEDTLQRARRLVTAQLTAVSDARGGLRPGDLAIRGPVADGD